LARKGVPVVVCEGEPSLTHDLRAGSFHPPTLEMMAPYGITERMHEHGLQVRRWQIRSRRGAQVAEFDLGLLADLTPYPYRLHLEQHRLTPIQLDILRKEAAAEVHFRHRITGFEQKARSVLVKFESEGIPGKLEAAYLVGADGGRSTIRKLLRVEFEGFTWPEQFLVVSTPYDFGRHGFTMNAYIADPVEWAAVFKMPDAGPPGLWRLAFPCDPGLPDDVLLDPGAVQKRMQGFLPGNSEYEIRYQSIYRVHQRVASEWRHGRVLLAGDAAHLNNPLGGFGLNSGIHDAVNLAEKLAKVWHGEARDDLLDVYVRQRRATTIDQVQAMSIRNKRLLEERDPGVQRSRMEELVAVAADPQRARQHMLESSMIAGLRKSMEEIH
ncbi:MAG TPA: FAD-dependent monooxygenase, partial [Burkholderiales bacterium]|nr:FAD-dependent monooxygenase [Burkholderiales bacterium]